MPSDSAATTAVCAAISASLHARNRSPSWGFRSGSPRRWQRSSTPESDVVVEPPLVVGQEEQDERRPGDERLVVARPGKGVLRRLIVHLDDRVEHHVARGRRAQGRLQEQFLILRADRPFLVGADGLAVEQEFDGFVHRLRSFRSASRSCRSFSSTRANRKRRGEKAADGRRIARRLVVVAEDLGNRHPLARIRRQRHRLAGPELPSRTTRQ